MRVSADGAGRKEGYAIASPCLTSLFGRVRGVLTESSSSSISSLLTSPSLRVLDSSSRVISNSPMVSPVNTFLHHYYMRDLSPGIAAGGKGREDLKLICLK